MTYRIPFNKPGVIGNELQYVASAITGGHVAGDGSFTAQCHAFLEHHLGVAQSSAHHFVYARARNGCSVVDIRQGDEIIVPSFTFVSTVNAFVLRKTRRYLRTFAKILLTSMNGCWTT